MLKTTITHHTYDDDDPDTTIFYNKLIEVIDELTVKSNDTGRPVALSFDEDMTSVTIELV